MVVDPATGKVESAKVFDTYKTSSGFDGFIAKGVPDGFIVVAACKDEFVSNLSESGKQWFAKMGSKDIWRLQFRQGFAFIGKSGITAANEEKAV